MMKYQHISIIQTNSDGFSFMYGKTRKLIMTCVISNNILPELVKKLYLYIYIYLLIGNKEL